MSGIEPQQTWSIRPLSPDEIGVVSAVLGLARLHQGTGTYLVAWADSAALGHVYVAWTEPPELQDLEVRLAYRRRGVATALLAAAEAAAEAHGFHEIRLEVSVSDPVAQALYVDSGYVDAGLPIRRVTGRVALRTGWIDVDDSLQTLSKPLPRAGYRNRR